MKPITIILVVIGVVFFVIGFVYLTTKVRDLPQLLGGHAYNPKHPKRKFNTTYKKRAVAAFFLGILAFVGAYYTTRARKTLRVK